MPTNRTMTSTSSAPKGDLRETIRLLDAASAFPGAPKAQLREIAAAGQVVTVPKGWSLIWDRTPAEKAYVVLTGQVDVRHGDEVVATLGTGDVIGELAILHRRLRSAAVVAATPLTVLHFGRDQVERLYAEVPAFRSALDRAAEERS